VVAPGMPDMQAVARKPGNKGPLTVADLPHHQIKPQRHCQKAQVSRAQSHIRPVVRDIPVVCRPRPV